MMQCIAFATADQYHLPTLCHDLIHHGFQEMDLPRGATLKYSYVTAPQGLACVWNMFCDGHILISDASNVLVISTDKTTKPDDDALMFFFRYK